MILRFFQQLMDKNLRSEKAFFDTLKNLDIPDKHLRLVWEFIDAYKASVLDFSKSLPCLFSYLEFLKIQIEAPFQFEHFHKKIREPKDYYQFGLDFIKPLIDFTHSSIEGMDNLKQIQKIISKQENVVLLANHQTESDPQAIAAMLECQFPQLAESIIYVAGERVLTDPLAVPFSLGCDLLCIYSKRYIDHPPEQKAEKQSHNKKTMKLMSKLLQEGGKVIYVAPSGGRDRKNTSGKVEVAKFDPDSVEMFYLMAKLAKTPTHFFPLTLSTYNLLPPPDAIQTELGEKRIAQRTPIHLGFNPEFDMDQFSTADSINKQNHRENRAKELWNIVNSQHERFLNF